MNVSEDAAALILDPNVLGLTRTVVETALGPVTVHYREATGRPREPDAPSQATDFGTGWMSATVTTTMTNEPGVTDKPGVTEDADGIDRSNATAVLLHGAAGSWTTWTTLLAEWDRRDDGFRRAVVLVDFPGWGDSPFPDDEDSYTIEALGLVVLDAVDAVTTTMNENVAAGSKGTTNPAGGPRLHLVGHSLGGFVALHLAATVPERTVRVDLVSAVSFAVIDSGAHPVRAFRRLPGFTALLQGMRFLATLPGGGLPFVGFLARCGLMPALSAPLFDRRRPVHPSVLEALSHELRPRTFVAATKRAARYPAKTLWRGITSPVHLVSGERDVFVARDDPAALARTIPTLRRTRLRQTGHFAHIENLSGTLAAWDGDTRGRP